MKENVGRADRFARSVLGPALMMLGFNWLGGLKKGRGPALAALVGGTIILATAVTKVCPLNKLFHINTSANNDYELGAIPKRAPQAMLPQV